MTQDLTAFFDAVRPAFGGKFSQEQVEGIEALLRATEGLSIARRAYILATAKIETAHTMQPITEYGPRAYFNKYEPGTEKGKTLGNIQKGDGYLYRGRGYVQITGRANYRKAGVKLGLNLENQPTIALIPKHAGDIIVRGMSEGWFTKYSFESFPEGDYVNWRRIVNGTDRAQEIARLAVQFESALRLLTPPAPPPKSTFADLLKSLLALFKGR